MAVATYTKAGTKAVTPVKLDKAVFDVNVENHDLLKSAYVGYLANGRKNLAVTKTRGLVSGGGKKPWKQKGTGRARFGSSRNPIWRGGGIAFGPTGQENYTHKLTPVNKRTAVRQALTLAAQNDGLIIIETFECKDGKVGPTIKLLEKINAKGNILLVVSNKDDLVDKATRNLSNVKAVQASYLNVYDILNADTVVMSKKSVEVIHEWLKLAKPPTEVVKGAK